MINKFTYIYTNKIGLRTKEDMGNNHITQHAFSVAKTYHTYRAIERLSVFLVVGVVNSLMSYFTCAKGFIC